MLLAPLPKHVTRSTPQSCCVVKYYSYLGSFQHIQPDCYAPQRYDYIADSEKRINEYQCVFSEIGHSDYV